MTAAQPPSISVHPRHLQRAATAVDRALELVARACAVFWDLPHEVPNDPLDGLDHDETGDVCRALGDLLELAVGRDRAIELLRQGAPTPLAAAETVARVADYDIGQVLSGRDYVRQRAQFYAAQQAYKPEDAPDWR
ncbi:hypothetical protein MHPYR_80162 [uncultured Mycobacterium sp.]|uniref:Uncharacterized protein n=1 Tax=uncultured Mycobacterium sp. TaxID=171292 RepID=A0A1Y5PLJ6_9MYCO|nr:hypothetical protein MHPYR_80162 [uncultured Mycobacterium sp.]